MRPEINTAVLNAAVENVLPSARADLESLVRIPSIWADPAHRDDTRRSAAAVAELARAAGAADVDIVSASAGAPAVIARWPAGAADAPHVLLYAHHDVQPTGGDEKWTSPPFEPTERGGRLYGRGAADDKAGVMAHLAVIRAFRSLAQGDGGRRGGQSGQGGPGGPGGIDTGRLPVGVTLFIEGEEESGSPTLPALLAEHRDKLAADVIVIADSGNPATDVPALTTSLRGLVDCVVEVRMLERPVHSGVYGGPLGDALTALCRLLATLHDDKGRVAIPGLVHNASGAPDLDEATFRSDAAVLDGVELIGTGTLPERLWQQPAVSVLGIDAPKVSEVANVLLPSARAAVSLRLAPGQDPLAAQRALHEHLRTQAPWGAAVTVTPGMVGAPFALDPVGEVYDTARRTFAAAYGNDTVEVGIGGSIPFIAEFARAFPGAAVLVTGVGDPASRWHGIDESLHLGMFGRAVLAEALLLAELGPHS